MDSPSLRAQLQYPEGLLKSCTTVRNDTRPRNTWIGQTNFPVGSICSVIVKRYRPLRLWASFRDRFRQSRSISAFEKAISLRDCGVETITPIAASENVLRDGRTESIFLMEKLSNAAPLREIRKASCSLQTGRKLIRALAETLARLHDRCWSHSDPSLSNFFVQKDKAPVRIVLIDLDALRKRRMEKVSRISDELAHLFRRIPMTKRERVLFISTYCQSRKRVYWKHDLVLEAEKKLSERSLRDVRSVVFGNLKWEIRNGALPDGIAEILREPERYLQDKTLYLKNSRVVTIARIKTPSATTRGFVLRRLNYGKLKHRWRDAFRHSRARRALRHGLALERNGIDTPRAFAAADVRNVFWPRGAYLLMEEIPRAQNLMVYLAQTKTVPRALPLALGKLLARLHNKRFSHRDLKATNLLLDEHLHPFLIDLDGLKQLTRLSPKRIAADLARLAEGVSSQSEKLKFARWRFLKTYAQHREPSVCVRSLAMQIKAKLAE